MANNIVAGDTYFELDGQLLEIKRQLRQPNGYPFNPHHLKFHLQAAIEGCFIGPEQYPVEMGGDETADMVVAYLRSEGLWVEEYINSKLFPLVPGNPRTDVIEILDPFRGFKWDEIPALLAGAGLDAPTGEHFIRFSKKYGKAMAGKKSGKAMTGKKPYVLFPHEPVVDQDGNRRLGCVRRDPQDRGVCLDYLGGWFGTDYVLAGVRCAQPSVS